MLVTPIGLLGAGLIVVNDSPALLRFAFLRNDAVRYAVATVVVVVTLRVGSVGLAWRRHRRPVIEITHDAVTIFTVFDAVSCLFAQIDDVELLPGGGLRIVTAGKQRRLTMRLDGADWGEVYSRLVAGSGRTCI